MILFIPNSFKYNTLLKSPVCPQMGLYQLLPFGVTVDLRVMAMEGYSAFLKAPRSRPHHQMEFTVIPEHSLGGGSYFSAKGKSEYSTALSSRQGKYIP